MKCQKCGNELEKGVAFCRECGTKVQTPLKIRFCRECGAELKDGDKFCFNCGADIHSIELLKQNQNQSEELFEEATQETVSVFTQEKEEKTDTRSTESVNAEEAVYTDDNNADDVADDISDNNPSVVNEEYSYGFSDTSLKNTGKKKNKKRKHQDQKVQDCQKSQDNQELQDIQDSENTQESQNSQDATVYAKVEEEKKTPEESRLKKFLKEKWKGLDRFSKVCTVVLGIIILLFIFAILTRNGIKIFLYILCGAMAICAVLIHKDKITFFPKWTKYIALCLAFVLTFSTMFAHSEPTSKTPETSNKRFSASSEEAEEPVKTVSIPVSEEDCIGENYLDIAGKFETAGFTNIRINKVEDLKASEEDQLKTVSSILIDGKSDFSKSDSCQEDAIVVIEYHSYAECAVNVHINFNSNILFDKYDVKFLFDDKKIGELSHGEDADFELTDYPGEYTVEFVSVDSSDVKGDTSLEVDGDVNVSYTINCESDKIKITKDYEEHLAAVEDDEIMMPGSADDYISEDYSEVESTLKDLGFSKISTKAEYDIVFGVTEEKSTASVSINGNKDFKRGDIFKKTDEVIITYHMKEEDDPENSESAESTETTKSKESTEPSKSTESDKIVYSTNDSETVKKGNTGAYAYIHSAQDYDIYYIIDFDEGYVYGFNTGDSSCERVRIDSGTLNDQVTITYHDGDSVWSYNLKFTEKNNPEKMTLIDQDGFTTDFVATDYKAAINLKNKTKIHDY